jgi:cardiolipin synthase
MWRFSLAIPLLLHHVSAKQKRRDIALTIPNLITIMRFLLVPAVVLAMLNMRWDWAFAGFLVAGISDGVDGFIARRFNQHSKLGAYLDPMADKVLLVSVFVVMGFIGELPLWLVVTMVSRDGLIVCAVVLSTVMAHPVEMKPLYVSKANTAAQIALAAVVLGELALGLHLDPLRPALILLSGVLTVASAAAYLVAWLRHMSGYGEGSRTSNSQNDNTKSGIGKWGGSSTDA